MTESFGCVLLTGRPGVGKTTLIRNVCQELLDKHNIKCCGFYTEEVRNMTTHERIGFDVVTLNGKRGILARTGCNGKGPFVGKYCVNVQDFEDLALPLLNTKSNHKLLVVDEIGKMELKSKKFESCILSCMKNSALLATVPYEPRPPLNLVDKLKNHPKAKVIVVTKENRNHVQSEIMESVLHLIK